MLGILDRVERLTTGEKGCLESTKNKTVRSSEQAWNEHVKFQEMVETTEKKGDQLGRGGDMDLVRKSKDRLGRSTGCLGKSKE